MGVGNRGYNKETFVVTSIKKDYAVLPNVGKFCKCGCMRSLSGRKDKEFFNDTCYHKFYRKQKGIMINYKKHLPATINLEVIKGEKTIYRKISVYLIKGHKEETIITPANKMLWKLLDKIQEQRQFKK